MMVDEKIQCEVCEKEVFRSDSVQEDDQRICRECYNKEKCEHCNKRMEEENMRLENDKLYCPECADNICEVCEEVAEYPRETEKGVICERCLEDDRCSPTATIEYSDRERRTIGHYHNGTEGDFETTYHSTDAWRGYYTVEANNGWEKLWDDNILSYSEDAKELKKMDEKLTEYMDKNNIEYAKAIARSSNVFSNGYTLFVRASEKEKAMLKLFVNILSMQHRDSEKYRKTALTGKDPEDLTEEDEKFAELSKRVMDGEDPKEVLKDAQK